MVLSWSKLHAVSCFSQEAKEMFYALQISTKLSSPSLSLHEILCFLLGILFFLFEILYFLLDILRILFWVLCFHLEICCPLLEILCFLLEILCFLFCPNSYVREKICYFFAKTWYFVLHSTKLCLDLQHEIVLFIGKLLKTWLSRPLKSDL